MGKRQQISPDMLKMMIETNAEDEDRFIEGTVELVRDMLTKGNLQYRNIRFHHGMAQRFIRRVLSESIPFLHDYEADPEEHLRNIAQWLAKAGNEEECRSFETMFPRLEIPGR